METREIKYNKREGKTGGGGTKGKATKLLNSLIKNEHTTCSFEFERGLTLV